MGENDIRREQLKALLSIASDRGLNSILIFAKNLLEKAKAASV